jgi:hypothetical protein
MVAVVVAVLNMAMPMQKAVLVVLESAAEDLPEYLPQKAVNMATTVQLTQAVAEVALTTMHQQVPRLEEQEQADQEWYILDTTPMTLQVQ